MDNETSAPEEIKTEEQTAHPKDVRNSPIFSELREKNRELERKLAEIEMARESAAKEAQQKKLEEEGRYKEVLAQKEAELKSALESHKREILSKSLENELIRSGANNPLFIKGAISSYDGDETGISDYIKSLSADESNSSFFGTQTSTKSVQPAPVGVSPAVGGNTDWSQLKQSLNDPAKAAEASRVLTDYIVKNGHPPQGF